MKKCLLSIFFKCDNVYIYININYIFCSLVIRLCLKNEKK